MKIRLLSIALFLCCLRASLASTITVTTTSNIVSADADLSSVAALQAQPGSDGAVSLREAIIAANAGGGSNTIYLQAGVTYSFARVDVDNYWYGPNALPPIISSITIEGNGATLQRSNTVGSTAESLRFFYVSGGLSGLPAGNLTLKNLTLTNGLAKGGDGTAGGMGAGGAIFNQGFLTLNGVTLTNNTALGGSFHSGHAGGGGIGEDGQSSGGGGFGGPVGNYGGLGAQGGGGFNDNAVGALGGGHSGLGSGAGDGGDGQGDTLNYGGNFGQGGRGDGIYRVGVGVLVKSGGGGVGGGGGYGGNGDGFHGGSGGFGGGGGDSQGSGGGAGGFGGGGGSLVSGGFGGGHGGNGGGGGAGMGGAVFSMYGTVNATNCTFAGNKAQGGGAFESVNFFGTILFSGGVGGSGFGAAILNLDGTANLVHCTIANNTVQFGQGYTGNGSATGTALYNIAYGGRPDGTPGVAVATLTNSILSDLVNYRDGTKITGTSATVTATMNGAQPTNIVDVAPSNTGGTITGQFLLSQGQPVLDPAGLHNNRGPTQTIALAPGSIALNAGIAATYPGTNNPITTDQRGAVRDATPDIGAFEQIYESLVVNTIVDENNGDSDPAHGAGTSLREAIAYANWLGGAQTITFAPALAGQTINLTVANGNADGWDTSSALSVTGDITINGLTNSPGVTLGIGPGAALRHFVVRSGAGLTLTNLTLTGGNPQLTNFDRGGAISAYGNLTARNCTFTGNTSPGEGGAIQNWPGADTLVLENCTFSGNSGGSHGGAFSANGNQATLRYVTITNNTAPYSAMVLWGTQCAMVNTILDGNSNDSVVIGNGGGFGVGSLYNVLGSGDTDSITNGVNGNLTNVPVAQLLLGPLANNGGPTPTIALGAGSLAIDAGGVIGAVTTDQRGTSRPQADAPDVGAFELVPSQTANIPVITPLGGTYQSNVQIGITNTSTGAIIRYTVDGSTPSSSNGQLYNSGFTLTNNATVKAIAYGHGWLPSAVASVDFGVLTPLPYWRALQTLAADGSQDSANPSGDGISNLAKFAFNLAPNAGDLSKANYQILTANGIAGLPLITRDDQGRLVIEFVRRKTLTDPGVSYIVETGTDLVGWNSLDLATASVVSIDEIWERVTVIDPVVSSSRFGRVRVTSLGTYYDDFNLGPGPVTLNGSAIYLNQAVQLTDGVTQGQLAAVIFSGASAGPQLTGFTANFNLNISASGTPADGISFAVGTLTSTWGESGPGTSHSLAVGFDTYPNGGTGDIGIHIWVNGVHIAANATDPFTNGATVPVEIFYDQGGLTVMFNGTTIFNNLPIGDFSFQSGDQFGIGARTGGAVERAVVDDVQITPH